MMGSKVEINQAGVKSITIYSYLMRFYNIYVVKQLILLVIDHLTDRGRPRAAPQLLEITNTK